ncbi:crumbs 2, cell polarity complex component S homeolog isoform X2 [Xenopus laevis]|uniref:Crumbs 2, cell polarity complex component S homeolog isoform X2 n=1 Tax=Xenopus laevis TaxID=8355 RepID=A0A8J1LLG6_XENLA|nr:crumbs 2, cell polarity complex component S homeolog isoform X2 [Xenopus laevis]
MRRIAPAGSHLTHQPLYMDPRRKSGSLASAVLQFLLFSFAKGLAQTCMSSPCLNGGTCLETSTGFTCLCPMQPLAFTGPTCGDIYDACAVYGCPSTHRCQSTPGLPHFQCVCQPGFNCTNECQSNSCPFLNSHCTVGEDSIMCKCQSGYGGVNCQYEVSPCFQNTCQNNATCLADAESYRCLCEPGFTGQDCEVNINECASDPCQNEALCVDKVNRYMCFCVPGFQGHHCEIDINECASRPCQNNGTCLNQLDQYECACANGYTGVNCEIEIDECQSGPCQNGATCWDHIGYFTCDCPAGYDGELCQQDIDECQSQPCQNGGRCVDEINRFQCDCSHTGFVGDHCEIEILECDSNPCQNNATCVERVKGYECLCWRGYSGIHCETDDNECTEKPCENGGLCLQLSNQSYYGTEPEFGDKFSYSQAAGYLCRCQPGFTGSNCSVNINECESGPCVNGGTCIDLINGFLCSCVSGYTGVGCSINIDECEDNPCKNGASCEDGVADYFCVCRPEAQDGTIWGGKNCSVKLVGCLEHSCQNRAECIPLYNEEKHSYTCKCQPGFAGENCSIPTTFSFLAQGYIMYDLLLSNESYLSNVSVRFRTTLPDMVLMYRGDEDSFLILELYNGFLYIRLKGNGRLFQLVIDNHKVNDGYWHNVEVDIISNSFLKFRLFHNGCRNGLCSRKQPLTEGFNPYLPESFSLVYIGGLVQEALIKNTLSQQNFTGCLEDLVVDLFPQLPHNVSSDRSFGMEPGCRKVELCHPNPCHNGANCIDLWSNFTCDCIRPYKGPTCMQEYIAGTFFREGTPSHTYFELNQDLGMSFNVSAFIRTLKPDGLLLQISHREIPYFSIYLNNSWVHIETLSAQPLVFKKKLSDGMKYFISISVREGNVTVTEPQQELYLGKVPPVTITKGDAVYVGGLATADNTTFWGGFFKGCLQDVRINNYHLEFFPTEEINVQETLYLGDNTNVTQNCVSDDICRQGPCRNNGNCSVTWNDFVCSCPSNFTGKRCEEPVWCERSPCSLDSTCVDVPKGFVCLANASFHGHNSAIFIPNISEEHDLTSISLTFRTRDRDAVLLQASKNVDFFLIAIQEGYLFVDLQSGNNVDGVQLNATKEVADAIWHRVVITMEKTTAVNSQWTFQLDDNLQKTFLWEGGNLNFLRSNIFISLAKDYTGCLGEVSIGGIYLPFTDHVLPQQDQFIRKSDTLELGCQGADVCTESPCLHSGTCQDLFNSFSCACRTGWNGQRCEINIDDCKSSPCLHGTCKDLEADYQCSCETGYAGTNCSININDCQHHQCLNGGTCVDGVNSYTCKCPANYAGTYCQWPFPPEQCNKNFTCFNGGKCDSGIWGANCTCRPGFKGRRCEINVNDCESNPCLNGGTCQDSVNTFKCICNSSFSGVRCEKPRLHREAKASTLVGSAIGTGMLFILLSVIAAVLVTMRKKRATQGTYSPSHQEKDGARVEMWNVLKLPPTERLI